MEKQDVNPQIFVLFLRCYFHPLFHVQTWWSSFFTAFYLIFPFDKVPMVITWRIFTLQSAIQFFLINLVFLFQKIKTFKRVRVIVFEILDTDNDLKDIWTFIITAWRKVLSLSGLGKCHKDTHCTLKQISSKWIDSSSKGYLQGCSSILQGFSSKIVN